jgi:hypothetical protein
MTTPRKVVTKPPKSRAESERRLNRWGGKRIQAESALGEAQSRLEEEIRWATGLFDVPRTRIAFLTCLNRSRIYQILGKGKEEDK